MVLIHPGAWLGENKNKQVFDFFGQTPTQSKTFFRFLNIHFHFLINSFPFSLFFSFIYFLFFYSLSSFSRIPHFLSLFQLSFLFFTNHPLLASSFAVRGTRRKKSKTFFPTNLTKRNFCAIIGVKKAKAFFTPKRSEVNILLKLDYTLNTPEERLSYVNGLVESNDDLSER